MGGDFMYKINKRLVLMLVAVLIIIALSGCSGKLPDGIESKKFYKSVSKIYDASLKSMSERQYYKAEIESEVDSINTLKDNDKLNEYELLVFEKLVDVLDDVESDLTTGDKTIKSETLDRIKSIKKLIDN